jgi:hypothetical protein
MAFLACLDVLLVASAPLMGAVLIVRVSGMGHVVSPVLRKEKNPARDADPTGRAVSVRPRQRQVFKP